MTAFGKAPDDTMAVRGADFIPRGRGFLFKRHPGVYATETYTDDGDLRYMCISVGNALTVTHRPQDVLCTLKTQRTARQGERSYMRCMAAVTHPGSAVLPYAPPWVLIPR